MAEVRQTVIERDRRRQTDALLQRVQHILNNIQLKKVQKEADSTETPTSDCSVTLGSKARPIRSCVRTCEALAQKQTLSPSSSLKRETLRLLNQHMKKLPSDESNDGSDPESPDSSLCLSLTGSYAQLPSPQPSRSPSARNILISSPVSESELSQSETHLSGANNVSTASPPSSSGGHWNCSGSEFSDGQLSIITSTPSSTRSDETQDVSREKPRPARRSAPAPLNRSYDMENPSPSLNRPQVDSGPIRRRLETEKHSLQLQINIKQLSETDSTGVEQQIQALEVLRERLEREHTQQISELLTAQGRQTQHLQQIMQQKQTDDVRDVCVQEIQRKLIQHSSLTSHTQEEQMKAFCRHTSVTRGFLTRRLLQTDKITQLRKTIQASKEDQGDSQELTGEDPPASSQSQQHLLLSEYGEEER